jgi:RNase P subunit RPR2
MGYANKLTTRTGKVAAICQCCGTHSKATTRNHKGEPELWDIGRGWSQAPFPADFKHSDGSMGSTYTCAACNRLLTSGATLTLRNYSADALAASQGERNG